MPQMFQADSFSGYNHVAFTHKIVFKAFRMNTHHFVLVQVKNMPVFGVHVIEVQGHSVNICSKIITTDFHSILGKGSLILFGSQWIRYPTNAKGRF